MEYYLDENVAQLFAHVRVIALVDRFDEFADFIDEAAHERRVRLFLVPRAAIRRPQPSHRLAKIVDRAHLAEVAYETLQTHAKRTTHLKELRRHHFHNVHS
jgi:hypothetical protein